MDGEIENLIWAPPAGGLHAGEQRYPGFPAVPEREVRQLATGQAIWLEAGAGDLLHLQTLLASATLHITCLHPQGTAFPLPALQDLPSLRIDPTCFDADELRQRCAARGLDLAALLFRRIDLFQTEGALFWEVTQPCSLLLALPADMEQTIEGQRIELVEMELRRRSLPEGNLPDPLWTPREEFTVPRASARAYELRAGEFVQVIDVAGRQCSDFMAMHAARLAEGRECHIDSTVSRTLNGNAYPVPGLFDKFFDQDMTHLLSVIQDTVGRHDTFALACTARGYEDRGYPGHLNCSDNISSAYEEFGIKPRAAWPAINFFFNSWIDAHQNHLSSDEAWSRPGDYVLMQAQTDLVCVSTACPDDIDPINGWNPTDVHVRIYAPEARLRKSVAYRATPEAKPVMTAESPFHSRTAPRTRQFGPARDYWMPQVFEDTGMIEEYWACKSAATLQDMSGLRKLDVVGPDAEKLLQLGLTRNIARLAVHRGTYALICDPAGTVIDDGTLFRLAPDLFRWCCGSDESLLHLRELAEKHGLKVWLRDVTRQLCNLALQGPHSRDILSRVVTTKAVHPALENLKWFGQTIARIGGPDGPSVMLTRTGFTGELGYEIFCDHRSAPQVWDAVMEAGEPLGLVPMGAQALEVLRIEAGLMVAGAEFGQVLSPTEAGLEFAVDLTKEEFVGRAAVERIAASPRHRLTGLFIDGSETPDHGDHIFMGRRPVGTVTSAARSPELDQVIAMARLVPEALDPEAELEIGRLDGHMKRLACRITDIPFIDPKRIKARA